MFRFLQWLGLLFSVLSIVLGFGILACYIARWNTVSAVTLLPFWVWGIIGTGLSLMAWQLQRRIWCLLLSLTWLCLTLFSSDNFLCQLHDGRVLVVEYKGEHLYADAGEKRAVGAVWESRSKGKCLFIMPEGNDLEAIKKKIAGK